MSTYLIIKNALLASNYALESATRIAHRLARHKDPIHSLNLYLGEQS